jgi:hypothetical protein
MCIGCHSLFVVTRNNVALSYREENLRFVTIVTEGVHPR